MKKKYVPILMFIVLITSIIFYTIHSREDYLPKMKEMVGSDCDLEHVSGQLHKVLRGDILIGFIDQQSAIGYAGPVDVLVFVGCDGIIKDIDVVKQTETPSFFHKVISEGFCAQLCEKEITSKFQIGEDLDGVTNATYTSRAIAEAVRKASYNVAVTQLNINIPRSFGIKLSAEHCFVFLLLITVATCYKFKWLKIRYVTLFAGFILIGCRHKSLLTIGNFSSVLIGNIPLHNMPLWLVLLLGVLLLLLFTGRNFYCFWMCPYGAISELLGAFGKFGRMNYKPSQRSLKRFKYLKQYLAWGALVFAFFMLNHSISSYEIFAPLFAWEGTSVQWFLLPLMLFSGIFIPRFWCRFFCPAGGILEFLVTCRKHCVEWAKNSFRGKKLSDAKELKCFNDEEKDDENAKQLISSKTSRKSQFFDVVIVVCTILIIIVLMQNAGMK